MRSGRKRGQTEETSEVEEPEVNSPEPEQEEEMTSPKKSTKKSPKKAKAKSPSPKKEKHSPEKFKPVEEEAEDSDDEAPEDVGFAVSKEAVLSEIRSIRESNQAKVEAKKAKNRARNEKFQEQKEEKRKRKELSLDVLNKIAENEREEKEVTFSPQPNRVKRFDEDDLDLDLGDAGRDLGSGVRVVSRKDERKLSRSVPESVLNFKRNMLYNNPKIRRESAADLQRRREKVRSLGLKTHVAGVGKVTKRYKVKRPPMEISEDLA